MIIVNNNVKRNLSNPDDELFSELKGIFDPLDLWYVNNGGFGAPFIYDDFINLILLADNCTMAKYKFVNADFEKIFNEIKIDSYQLVNLMRIYTYPDKTPVMQSFEYLEILKKVSYMPNFYSPQKVKEHEDAFRKSNELFAKIIENYHLLVETYNKDRFAK